MKCVHNKKATGSISVGNGGRYPLYRFDCPDCTGKRNFTNSNIHGKYMDYLRRAKYDKTLVEALKIAISINWEKRNAFVSKKANDLEKRSLDLKAKEQKIIDKMLDGVFNDEIGKEQLDKVRKEQAQAVHELKNIAIPKQSEKHVINYGLNFMQNLAEEWQNQNDLEIKQRFQNFFSPEGIIFNQNQEFETAVSPLCMRIKALYATNKYTLVAPRGIEPLFKD